MALTVGEVTNCTVATVCYKTCFKVVFGTKLTFLMAYTDVFVDSSNM